MCVNNSAQSKQRYGGPSLNLKHESEFVFQRYLGQESFVFVTLGATPISIFQEQIFDR